MQNIQFPVIVSTLYVLFFTIVCRSSFPLELIMILFAFSPFVLIWLVIRMLKDGVAPEQKFSEGYWYCDVPHASGLPEEN
ncbi:MAG: hypothetical protein NZ551_04985 [Microscillaceae bacterium]|nr:hypothetical protein [Microscillaceae bacterium]MDW8460549.1 hypothetical protein [Cytophagales bacterium]